MSKNSVSFDPSVGVIDASFAVNLQGVVKRTKDRLAASASADGAGQAIPDARAEGYGLVKGKVKILDNLSAEYAQSIHAASGRLLGWIRRCAVGLCAITALAVISTAPSARADDVNPLLGLVDAATQRLQTAEPVSANKWLTDGSIEDPARVGQVLAAVSADAKGRAVDPAYVRQIFTDQVHATEAIEYTRFAQWKLDPGSVPGVAPDLAASRGSIDRLNTEMVQQVALHWSVLHSPDCAATLDDAKTAVTNARMLDPLYQQALASSMHSYCAR